MWRRAIKQQEGVPRVGGEAQVVRWSGASRGVGGGWKDIAGQLMAREAGRNLVYRARWDTIGVEWAVCREVSDHWVARCRSAPPTPRGEGGWREWEEVDWVRLAPMVLPLGAWMFAARVAAAGAERYANMCRNR